MENKDFVTIKTDILLMKKDLRLIEKALANLDKNTSSLSDIYREVAVQQKTIENLDNRIIRVEHNSQLELQNDQNFRKELSDKFEEFKRLNDLNKKAEYSELLTEIKDLSAELKIKNVKQDDRIQNLDQWKWKATGAIIVLSFIISFIWKTFVG